MDTEELIFQMSHADEDTVGKLINQAADSYRDGHNLRSLIPLLKHTDSRVVSVGTWIASEVVDGIRGREIFNELAVLLEHPDPAIRFGVIESIALLVNPDERSVIYRLFLLVADSNPGVRQQALYWVCQIPESFIETLRETILWPIVRLLLRDASKDDIRVLIKSEILFEKRIAFAAAFRKFGSDECFIKDCLPYFDDEVLATLHRLRIA